MAQIDDLNTALAALQSDVNNLKGAQAQVDTAVAGVATRVAALPGAVDLTSQIQLVNSIDSQIQQVTGDLTAQVTNLNNIAP